MRAFTLELGSGCAAITSGNRRRKAILEGGIRDRIDNRLIRRRNHRRQRRSLVPARRRRTHRRHHAMEADHQPVRQFPRRHGDIRRPQHRRGSGRLVGGYRRRHRRYQEESSCRLHIRTAKYCSARLSRQAAAASQSSLRRANQPGLLSRGCKWFVKPPDAAIVQIL